MNRREFIRTISVGVGLLTAGVVPKLGAGVIEYTTTKEFITSWVPKSEFRNPVALLYNLVCVNIDNIMVDHYAFLKRLQDCKVLIDPLSIPEGSLLSKMSFLAVKSNSVVTLLDRHMNALTISEAMPSAVRRVFWNDMKGK